MENFTLGLKKQQLFIYQFLGELMTFFEDISSAEFRKEGRFTVVCKRLMSSPQG
jgi:hypothetical protein